MSESDRRPKGTPIRLLPDDEEKRLVSQLETRQPSRILLASDLHLGCGRQNETDMFDPRENFLADEAFSRWLAFHADAQEPILLILIGDIFDFTRISSHPQSEEEFTAWTRLLHRLGVNLSVEELRRSVSRSERWFGLGTQDFKSVWKLSKMANGHRTFVAALGEWVARGHFLLFVKGNHDLELYWPLIRLTIRDALFQTTEDRDAVEERVAFAQDSVRIKNVYVEHGYRFEPMTRVSGQPTLIKNPDRLRYPLGSFLNRYIINRVERLDPFIDNIKPVQNAMLALLKKYPIKLFRWYFRAWRFVWKAAFVGRGPVWPTVLILIGLIVPLLTILGILMFVFWRPSWDWVTMHIPILTKGGIRFGASVVGLLFPALLAYLVGAFMEFLRNIGLLRTRDHVVEGARELLAGEFSSGDGWGRAYVIMGHTHRQEVRSFHDGHREGYYVNTGTWTPLWLERRKDLIGKTVYSFARFDMVDGEYRHKALEWNDDAKEPRPARILAYPDNRT